MMFPAMRSAMVLMSLRSSFRKRPSSERGICCAVGHFNAATVSPWTTIGALCTHGVG